MIINKYSKAWLPRARSPAMKCHPFHQVFLYLCFLSSPTWAPSWVLPRIFTQNSRNPYFPLLCLPQLLKNPRFPLLYLPQLLSPFIDAKVSALRASSSGWHMVLLNSVLGAWWVIAQQGSPPPPLCCLLLSAHPNVPCCLLTFPNELSLLGSFR